MSKVFFASSGSEANETAVKIAWYYFNVKGMKEKRKIIARRNGYHGSSIFSASLSDQPLMHAGFNLPIDGILFTDCPNYYRFADEGESEEDFASRLAKSLEDLIVAEGPETIAAFIAEPVMGVGGVVLPPKSYFSKIQGVLRKYDILMIADEVICGYGRTGNMFGSITFNIEPDIITCAKGLSSAYFPISAVIVVENIYCAMVRESGSSGDLEHGFTYSGHPVGAAIAVETLKILEERNILAHVNRMSQPFLSGLKGLETHAIVGESRGVGLMGALELIRDRDSRERFPPSLRVGNAVMERAQELGLFVRSVGDTIVIAPPLIIKEDEIDDLIRMLGDALLEVEAALPDPPPLTEPRC
jgi:4-aminobutyrate--pyruvate transaminase